MLLRIIMFTVEDSVPETLYGRYLILVVVVPVILLLLLLSILCGVKLFQDMVCWNREKSGRLTRPLRNADTETANVPKLIALTKKYTHIDDLTPEILNAFVDKIIVREREKKGGKRTQEIDLYYFQQTGK